MTWKRRTKASSWWKAFTSHFVPMHLRSTTMSRGGGGGGVAGAAGWLIDPQVRQLLLSGDLEDFGRFYDRYVAGKPDSEAPVSKDPPVVLQTNDAKWRAGGSRRTGGRRSARARPPRHRASRRAPK